MIEWFYFYSKNMRGILFLLFFILPGVSQLDAQSDSTSAHPFSWAERGTILSADTLTPLRVLKINNYADSVFLRMPSMPVRANPADTVLQHFVKRLFATVRDSMSLGVGIAAPQVGIHRQIIWVQRFDKEEEGLPFEVYLNPRIVSYSDSTKLTREGCLSIPNRSETVQRPCVITIEYDRMDGSHHKESIDGFTSVIFQHEIDHLYGILYLDHLDEEKKQARMQKRPAKE
jgi:peptide deformylase